MKNCRSRSPFPDHPSWHFPSEHIFSVWGHMSSHIPYRPHSAHSSTGDRAPVWSHQLCLSLIAASPIACSDSLGYSNAAPLETVILGKSSGPYVWEGDAGGGRLCDSAVGEIRAGGLVSLQFEPFHLSPPAACLNLQRSLISSTRSSASVRSVTAIFDISLVRVAELLHISSGKCTYGWTRFRWCHWEEKE